MAELIRCVLQADPDHTAVVATMSAAFDTKAAETPVNLAALFPRLPAPELKNLSYFCVTFYEVTTQTAQDTLFRFAKESDEQYFLVYSSAMTQHPKPRIYCLSTLDANWEEGHNPHKYILTWNGDTTEGEMTETDPLDPQWIVAGTDTAFTNSLEFDMEHNSLETLKGLIPPPTITTTTKKHVYVPTVILKHINLVATIL